MEYVYGALLLHSAGSEVDEEKLKKVLEGAGVTPDEARLKALVSSLKNVNIDEVLKNASTAMVQPAAQEKPAEKKEEKKPEKKEKDEKKEEASQEEALEGLSSLFG
ncbi:MAG: 50S ribosomal protein P1 [Candidatus Thermoplasmatota archaeon]|jgi:large subunit ribosomal protein L12|nr:50S ribosomal protein P1 [Candidatus Thermoplasmatota archaeon]